MQKNAGKLLERTKIGLYTIFRSSTTINQWINPSVKPFLNPPCSLFHPPLVTHRTDPKILNFPYTQKGFTHTETQTHCSQRPPTLPLLTKTPHFIFRTGLFCHAVTKSSHPVLVREIEIYWKRRWNWKQQMSEREKCHPRCSLWTSCMLQSDWHCSHSQLETNEKKKLVKKLSGSL